MYLMLCGFLGRGLTGMIGRLVGCAPALGNMDLALGTGTTTGQIQTSLTRRHRIFEAFQIGKSSYHALFIQALVAI